MTHTLILNKNWTPVNVTSVERSLVLMCRESAKALCPDTYEMFPIDRWITRSVDRAKELPIANFFRTTRYPVERPEIVILSVYGGIPFTEVNFTRRNLYKRDNYTCQYCAAACTPRELTIDHVLPRCLGGKSTWKNCVTSCLACNTKKADTPLARCGMKLLKEPRVPKWQPIAGMIPQEHPESWLKFIKYKA
jgi:5-methylcytosine-specific restriction endonuclease McrA